MTDRRSGEATIRVVQVKPGVLDVIVQGAREDDTYEVEIDARSSRPRPTSWLERLRSAMFDG